MVDVLDDANVLKQRDPDRILEYIGNLYQDTTWLPSLESTDNDGREIRNIVIAGMGGSALAADILAAVIRPWGGLPIEVVKGYDLPGYAWQNTLVIVSSQSGNTEEALSCYRQARERGCQMAALSAGGQLLDSARQDNVMTAPVPADGQPRMAVIKHLKALLAILETYRLIDSRLTDQIEACHDWLRDESSQWHPQVPIHENYAKQLALVAVGKTPVIYGGALTAPLAFKWKISWNENAKNIAFHNQYPEFNHNEFIGWTSHPIDKPFEIFDLISKHEHPRIEERMVLSDRLLSGKRPKATQVHLAGESIIAETLWGCVLVDFICVYNAILNNVDPSVVTLIEKFKKELK